MITVLPNGTIKVNISKEMIEIAQLHAEEVKEKKKVDPHSIRKGGGTVAGSLGELIVGLVYKDWDWNNSYDYDFTCNGISIDVKTKDRTIRPQLSFDASVSAYNTKQNCDLYMFVSITRDKETNQYIHGYIMGAIPKVDYFEKSKFWREGEIDTSNDWRASCDCYNIQYKELEHIPV
tara:strand:+ start:2092 stop:2622 length:531 start_codon:yes stop_codon:yes gene_type:complete